MFRKNWKIIKKILYFLVIGLVLASYAYLIIKNWKIIPFYETINLNISGISMPYWLFIIFSLLLIAFIFYLILNKIFSKIEKKYFN